MILGEHRKALGLFAKGLYLKEEAIDSILKTFDDQGFNTALDKLITEVELATGDRYLMDLAQLNALAGDEEKALFWYEKGFEAHHPMMPYIATVFGSGGPFKIDDPGFDSLLIRMNIPLE